MAEILWYVIPAGIREALFEILGTLTSWKYGYWSETNSFSSLSSNVNMKKVNLKYVNLKYDKLEFVHLKSFYLEFSNLNFSNWKCLHWKYFNLKFFNLKFSNLKFLNLKFLNLNFFNVKFVDLKFSILKIFNLKFFNLNVLFQLFTCVGVATGCHFQLISTIKLKFLGKNHKHEAFIKFFIWYKKSYSMMK
jgi:hypothetical protein